MGTQDMSNWCHAVHEKVFREQHTSSDSTYYNAGRVMEDEGDINDAPVVFYECLAGVQESIYQTS